jgi:hypothetical protein
VREGGGRTGARGGRGAGARAGAVDADYAVLELEEQIPENLKNILLVMADAGYLKPPTVEDAGQGVVGDGDGDDGQLWEETRRRLDRFLPGLFAGVFPEEVGVVVEG